MKLLLVTVTLAMVAGCCFAAPQGDVAVLEYEMDNIGTGDYKFQFKQSDGTSRTEQGVLTNAGTENEAISITGSFTWVAPDGQTYTINFVADENGYRPEGAHLPK